MRRIKLARLLQWISDLLPAKYPVRARTGSVEPPFFVFGSGRNGSTLLNRMLNQHDALFLPSEQYFLGNSIIKYKLYNFLLWRDLMKVIGGELLPATGSHTWDFTANEVIQRLVLLDEKSLEKVLDIIYRAYGEKYKAFRQWGDTTPLNTYYLPEILSVFPRARYIFLLRDGRDVIASYKAAGSHYLGELAQPVVAARHWVHSIERYEWITKKTDVLMVRYEDLVRDPEYQLAQVCAFLETDYQAEMLSFHQDGPVSKMYDEPQHANLRWPVFTDSVGKWQNVLTEEDMKESKSIEVKLGKYGYL